MQFHHLLRPVRALTALCILVPLMGLAASIWSLPADPMTGATPTLIETIERSGAAELLLRSIGLGLIVGTGAVAIGTILAWGEQRLDYPGRRVLSTLSLLPLAVPSYISAATFGSAFGSGGWLGTLLGTSRPRGFFAASIVLIVVTAPYAQLVIAASLARSSAAEEEAARLLGARPLTVFRRIVVPRLRPAIAYSGLIALLYAVSDFGAVAVLDVPVLTWRLYEAVQHQALARAATLGGALLIATIPVFFIARVIRGEAPAQSVANVRSPERTPSTGLLMLTTYAAHAVVIAIGALIPIVTMGGWVVDGLRRDLPFASAWTPTLQTTGLAAAGALATLLFALGPALSPSGKRRQDWVEPAVYLTSALPGVLLAFGLTLSALGVARTINQPQLYAVLLGSGALLVAGYALRFVAEVFGPLRAAVIRLDPRQRDAARTLGKSTLAWAHRVALPAMAPGVGAALLIGFVSIIKELPITLLLGSATGARTLAFRVWDRYNEALLHDAGLSGLLLVTLALVGVGATLRWRRHV